MTHRLDEIQMCKGGAILATTSKRAMNATARLPETCNFTRESHKTDAKCFVANRADSNHTCDKSKGRQGRGQPGELLIIPSKQSNLLIIQKLGAWPGNQCAVSPQRRWRSSCFVEVRARLGNRRERRVACGHGSMGIS